MKELTIRELEQIRQSPQKIINILDTDFDFKWDGLDYTIGKGETQTHPLYRAENCAKHMSKVYCNKEGIDWFKEGGKIVDRIFGKEHVEYNKLTLKQAQELAEERKISINDEKGKPKKKDDLIDELKLTH